MIEPLQKEYARLATDPGAIDALLAEGRDRALEASEPRLRAATRAMGLAGSIAMKICVPPPSTSATPPPRTATNAWPLRRDAAVAAIELLDADVVGLQEVLPDQLEYLRFRFPKYEIVGAGRDDGMSAGEHSSVLVRPGDWRIESLRDALALRRPRHAGLGRLGRGPDPVATLVWLRHRSGTTIGVLNTHYDHAGEVAQLQSSRLVAKWIAGDRAVDRDG